MNQPPAYFKNIEQQSIRRWQQLDADPELAAPWKQLFKQVKSPQHVISELLQNADDAGASSAWIDVSDGVFSFSHNGEDFTADQFASLCRFGYSNKRTLHTIGFRGIGFKSTFSIGDEVQLLSPTLDVTFHSKHFTLPKWQGCSSSDGKTTVCISIKDKAIESAILRNIEQWVTSPVSILFFKNLKEVHFNGTHVQKYDSGTGPTESSTRFEIRVDGKMTQELLLIESEEAEFPINAVQEIREERNLDSEDFSMPPCKLEIVLGLNGENRFFVVLPTEYMPALPFSVNAPFMLNPDRVTLKPLEDSPTNQWLIERTGELAAATFLEWVKNADLSLEERSKAYDLCPVDSRPRINFPPPFDYTEEKIREVFYARIKAQAILAADGHVHPAGGGVYLPPALYQVWDADCLNALFVHGSSVLLTRYLPPRVVSELAIRSWLTIRADELILEMLKVNALVPRPADWGKLFALWDYVARNVEDAGISLKELPLFPVKGDDRWLALGTHVIRAASRFERFSPDDAAFLLGNVKQTDNAWFDWLHQTKQRGVDIKQAERIISVCGLQDAARPEFLATQAAHGLFRRPDCSIADAVRMAHVFVHLDAEIPEGFHYVCQDKVKRKPSDHLSLADHYGLEDYLPGDWLERHCLHENYFKSSATCSSSQWQAWAQSKKSRLWVGLPLVKMSFKYTTRAEFEQQVTLLSGRPPQSYPYRRDDLELCTYDFPIELLQAIKNLSDNKTAACWAVLRAMLSAPELIPEETFKAMAYQHSGRGNCTSLDCGNLVPAWIIRFRSIRCLPDTHGELRVPSELMLRSPDTETVREIESFVHADYDNHRTLRLLKALGVRTTPSDFQTVIDRIKAFQQIPNPDRFLPQLNKFYEALDRIALRCDSDAMIKITDQFATQNIILTDAATWANSRLVSIHPDAEGSQREESIHAQIRHLGLWQRVGVSSTPSIERAIGWINDLPEGQKLSTEDIQRLRIYLRRDPERIWEATRHWLAMDGAWVPVESLLHRITMQSLTKTTDLFPALLKYCADLRMLTNEQLERESFASLRDLSGQIEMKATKVVEAENATGNFAWITCLGSYLARIIVDDEARCKRIRQAGYRMATSRFIACNEIEVTPSLGTEPAGPSRKVRVAWEDTRMLVRKQKTITLLDDLEKELSRILDDPEMRDVVKVCLDRDEDFIAEYLSTRFEFEPISELQPKPSPHTQEESQAPGSIAADVGGEPEVEDSEALPDAASDADDNSAEAETGETEGDESHDSQPIAGKDKPPAKPKADPRFETLKQHLKKRGFAFSPTQQVFTHSTGSCVQQKRDPVYCWEETDPNGEWVCRYWFANKTIHEGVDIPAELWTLMHQAPDCYQILEPLNEEKAALTSGREIIEGVNDNWIKVYPSRYLVRAEQIP